MNVIKCFYVKYIINKNYTFSQLNVKLHDFLNFIRSHTLNSNLI